MKKITVFLIATVTIMLFVACGSKQSHLGKCKAYLYKGTFSPDGLICVFYSSNKYVAEENARIFAQLHEEKFGIPLFVTTEAY
jgi:hypothetical protein